jgi:hypothetical protein
MDKNQKLATGLKWVGGILVAAVASPVIFLALKGILGLLAFGVAAGVGLALLKLTPWFSMKVSNLVMKLIIREAETNPIETLENLHIEKTEELHKADEAIVEFETEIRNYDDQRKEFQKQYPEEAASFTEISEKMHEALKLQKAEQETARTKLADLAQRIDKARAIYKMSLAAQRVTELSNSAAAKVYQEIKQKIAFESVQSELNSSFASLNMALNKRKTINTTSAFNGGRKVDVGTA